MAAGSFLTHVTGLTTLLSSGNWATADAHYAVLVTNSATPDRSTESSYSDISANECSDGDYDQVNIANKAVAVSGTNVRFDCDKINFGSSVTISARYLYVLSGDYASPQASDEIVGHVDLNDGGSADISSTNAEFSFDPHSTDGLFYVSQTS